MDISPFTTSRTFTVRLLPPRLPGRMSGSTWLHSASVKSLGDRSLLRSYRARFSIVHIGDLSTTQAAILASQTLDPIQYVPEQALRTPRQPSRSCTFPGRTAQPSIRPSVSTTAWRLRPLTCRVEDGRGGLGHAATPRFPSPPLTDPDVRICRVAQPLLAFA